MDTTTSAALIADSDSPPISPDAAADYWYSLLDEKEAGAFLGLTARTLQKMRQRGGGCKFIRISSRCLRYRRIDLREYAEARIHCSTSDTGEAAV